MSKKSRQPARHYAEFVDRERVGSSMRYVISEGAYGRLHCGLHLTDCDRRIEWSSQYAKNGHNCWRKKLLKAHQIIQMALNDLSDMERVIDLRNDAKAAKRKKAARK